MKVILIAVLSTILFACQTQTQNKTQLKTHADSVSYSIGLDIAKMLKQRSMEINPDALAQAFKDVLIDSTQLLSDETAQQVLTEFQQELAQKEEAAMREAGSKHKAEGDSFLAENKRKKDVVTLPSGLQYKVIVAGKGKKPKATETVTVNYRGSFIDGREFDSSAKRGMPATFACNSVIPGWTEALLLMNVGSKWELYVPPALAYGERGAGQVIPPNSVLIFEVELISVK